MQSPNAQTAEQLDERRVFLIQAVVVSQKIRIAGGHVHRVVDEQPFFRQKQQQHSKEDQEYSCEQSCFQPGSDLECVIHVRDNSLRAASLFLL